MKGFIKFILILGIGIFLYQNYEQNLSFSALNSGGCESRANANTKKCLKEQYAEERYIISQEIYSKEVQPYMNKLGRSMPRSGVYYMRTSEGERIGVKVNKTVTKGNYCPKKKRHLPNVNISFNTVKPIMVATD